MWYAKRSERICLFWVPLLPPPLNVILRLVLVFVTNPCAELFVSGCGLYASLSTLSRRKGGGAAGRGSAASTIYLYPPPTTMFPSAHQLPVQIEHI